MRFHASMRWKLFRGHPGRWLIESVTDLFSKRFKSQFVSSSPPSVQSRKSLSNDVDIDKILAHVQRKNSIDDDRTFVQKRCLKDLAKSREVRRAAHRWIGLEESDKKTRVNE